MSESEHRVVPRQYQWFPTGRIMSWAGGNWEQLKREPAPGGSFFKFHLEGRPDVEIEQRGNGYYASIDGWQLPTKFREYHTAARALLKAVRSEKPRSVP